MCFIMKKEEYFTPICTPFELRLEGVVCLSGGEAGAPGDPGSVFSPDDICTLEDLL